MRTTVNRNISYMQFLHSGVQLSRKEFSSFFFRKELTTELAFGMRCKLAHPACGLAWAQDNVQQLQMTNSFQDRPSMVANWQAICSNIQYVPHFICTIQNDKIRLKISEKMKMKKKLIFSEDLHISDLYILCATL